MTTPKTMQAFEDPNHPGNSAEHHSGKKCIEKGCENPAGTLWSPFWCHPCNVTRMQRIDRNLRSMVRAPSAADTLASLAKAIRLGGGARGQ